LKNVGNEEVEVNDGLHPYFKDYNGLQDVKHQILKYYLDAWYQILPRGFRRVYYVDTHAGRGRHTTGHIGSPLIALKSLQSSNHPDQVQNYTNIVLSFFELNEDYCATLNGEIGKIPVSNHVEVRKPICGDWEEHFSKLIDEMGNQSQEKAPGFAFIDPFNCGLSMELIRKFLHLPSCEVMINLMFLEIRKEAELEYMKPRLNRLYGSNKWEECLKVSESKERARCFARLFAHELGVKYPQPPIEMWAAGQIKYFLIHGTNHLLGDEKMKDAVWRAIPDGSYHAIEEDRPDQNGLIKVEPNFKPLRERIEHFISISISDPDQIYEILILEFSRYKRSHVKRICKEIEKENQAKLGQQGLF